jgi:hypothetical protein
MLYLVDKRLFRTGFSNHKRKMMLLGMASVYGVQETIFWATASFILVALALAVIADFAFNSNVKFRRLLTGILLVTSMSTYQFQAGIFLVFQYLIWRNQNLKNNRKFAEAIGLFVISSTFYLIFIKIFLILVVKIRPWIENFYYGERSISISDPSRWLPSLANHLLFDLHLFGPFIPIWLILTILTFLKLINIDSKRVDRDSIRDLLVAATIVLIILGPIILTNSSDQTLLFRTDIPVQVFFIFLVINSFSKKRLKIVTVLFSTIPIVSILLTTNNVSVNLHNEFRQLMKIEFETTVSSPICVKPSNIKPKLFTPFGMDLPRSKPDEWGMYTSNFPSDLPGLINGIYNQQRGIDSSMGPLISVLVPGVNTPEELEACNQKLDLNDILKP